MTSKHWRYGAIAVWRDGEVEYINHERIDRTTGKIGAMLTMQTSGERGWAEILTTPCIWDDFDRLTAAMQGIVNLHATERTA